MNSFIYTALERLYLIELLLIHGADNDAFAYISGLLKSDEFVQTDESFDVERLAPDALERLFLALLAEEVRGKGEASRTDAATNDAGSTATTSPQEPVRPSLPPFTFDDAYEHAERLPALADRLLAEWRDPLFESIREDDRRILEKQRLIERLEKAERERAATAAESHNGTSALVPQDSKPESTTKTLGQASPPIPAAAQAAAVKRVPITTTPVYPPKPPTLAAQQALKPATPSHLPSGKTTAKPTPSPKTPALAPGSVLKPAPVANQAGSKVVQPPPQVARPAIPPRPEIPAIASRPKDSTSTPVPAPGLGPSPSPAPSPVPAPASAPQTAIAPRSTSTSTPTPLLPQPAQPLQSPQPAQRHGAGPGPTSAGNLKWEKPYQPVAAQSAATPGQAQVVTPANVEPAPPKAVPQPRTSQQSRPAAKAPELVAQAGTVPGKPGVARSQPTGQAAQPSQPVPPRPVTAIMPPKPGQQPPQPPRAVVATPVPPPGRAQQPQPQPQSLPLQRQQTQAPPRPIAAAQPVSQKSGTAPIVVPQKLTPAQAAQQAAQQRPPRPASPVPVPSPLPLPKNKPSTPALGTMHPLRPAIPEHIIRQATAAAALAATPGAKKTSPIKAAPRTPGTTTPLDMTRGFGTKWASHSTPSTPRPVAAEAESPAFEPVSPLPRAVSMQVDVPKAGVKRDARGVAKTTPVAPRPRGRPPKSAQRGRRISTTPSMSRTRRSQSVASQADELSMDHVPAAIKIKHEAHTPRHAEETGDTTADESVQGRTATSLTTPGSVSSRLARRRRPDTPPVLSAVNTNQVLWTRGFTKVSSSALDQISSHRDANMFATGVREKYAPNYRQIVLQPQDITSVRAAIKQGNKAAIQAASSLPGGDPGTASVWLPASDELVPPRGIVNSAQLERELVHMFSNAIMYNPDPDRGPGAAFLKRNKDEEEEVVGYHVDENGVVKNTRSMFVEVEKLLGDLRSAEKERGARQPLSATRQASVATPADDTAEDEDELAGDGNASSTGGGSIVKRRRLKARI